VRGSRGSIACRLAPGADRDVVQVGVGAASSRLCNALYDARRDGALVFRADGLSIRPVVNGRAARGFEVLCTGPLTITEVRELMRVQRGHPWFEPLDREAFPKAPAGWCSWYYYYQSINEEEVARNSEWLAQNLKEFGCEWVQIDDGWQGRGSGHGSNRDWFVTSPADFPGGMKHAADHIRSLGLRPGIWCIPFTQSNTDLWESRPELFVHDADGGSPGELDEPLAYSWMPQEDRWYTWAGRYFLDATGPEGREYIERLFRMLCDEWGYDYVKIDAQAMMPGLYDRHRTRLADSSLDGDRAYRRGLSVIRDVMGRQRFLLNCGHGWPGVGLCEGIRTGGDVGASWDGMQAAISATMEYLYLNTIAFYTDPDVVCVREPLTLDQARVWATLTAVTGQLLMASDKMYELAKERVELLRRIYPVADIHPMELYALGAADPPGVFDLKVNLPGVGEWDVVALFNWGRDGARTFDLSPGRLGLEEREDGWIWLDAWAGDPLSLGDGNLSVTVPPTACRVVACWPRLDRPQFVGTSRHLTQGAVDVRRVAWDAVRMRLSGVMDVVGGHYTVVRIHVPEGWHVASMGLSGRGPVAELPVARNRSGPARWSVDFRRTGA
jgi:hypothetical protein